MSILSRWSRHAALQFSFAAYAARRMKMGLAEIACLEQIQVNGPLTPGEIGAWLHMGSGSVTALVDRLEHKGMITRTPSREDRRSYRVALSEGAFEATQLDMVPLARAIMAIVAEMSDDERAVVERFFDRLNAEIERRCRDK